MCLLRSEKTMMIGIPNVVSHLFFSLHHKISLFYRTFIHTQMRAFAAIYKKLRCCYFFVIYYCKSINYLLIYNNRILNWLVAHYP